MKLHQAALAIGGAVLSAGLLGATAFADVPADATSGTVNAPAAQKGDRKDRIADVLQRLVDKGVITAAQRDAIVDAFKAARHDGGDSRRFVGDVLHASSLYLGVPADQLKTQLKAGKSLAEIANGTQGKSRDGLVDALTKDANARIKAAVDAGKITPDQAEALRTKVSAAIVKIVDHEGRTTAAK